MTTNSHRQAVERLPDFSTGSLLQRFIVLPEDISGLFRAAIDGDAEAAQILQALRTRPPIRGCAICHRPAQPHTDASVMGLPYPGDPCPAVGALICQSCGPTREAVADKADQALSSIPGLSRSFILGAGSRA